MPFDNILEFVESPTGLNWTLLPVQRFILKLYYGIELDAFDGRIQIFDVLQERHRYTLTEIDYLGYLYGEGRCSVPDQSFLPRSGLVPAAGRRTGKTTLAELISCYTVIQMLQAGNPHEVFGWDSARSNLIASCYVGLNRDLINQFLLGVLDIIGRCPDLNESLDPNSTLNHRNIQFLTPEGRRVGLERGNLSVTALTSRTRTHGSSYYTLIMDDLAYMPNEQDVFDSRIPPILPSGNYAIMSTPRRAEGSFYDAFRSAMGSVPGAPLALQIPTWEVQPNIGPLLRREFEGNPTQFYIEYGARWPQTHREVRIELTV